LAGDGVFRIERTPDSLGLASAKIARGAVQAADALLNELARDL
jgi:hypothetical protein